MMEGMSKRETLILNIDIAIEKQAKEIIENVMAKFLADAHAELFKQFDKLSDDLKAELSSAAKAQLRSLIK